MILKFELLQPLAHVVSFENISIADTFRTRHLNQEQRGDDFYFSVLSFKKRRTVLNIRFVSCNYVHDRVASNTANKIINNTMLTY